MILDITKDKSSRIRPSFQIEKNNGDRGSIDILSLTHLHIGALSCSLHHVFGKK